MSNLENPESFEIKNKKRRKLIKNYKVNDEDSVQLLIKNEELFEDLNEGTNQNNKKNKLVLKILLNIWTMILFIVFISTFVISTSHQEKIDPSKVKTTLILFSLDGFRSEYLERKKTPTLAEISLRGVSAEYMTSQFPTETFPNHYSIITGLYPESHGIVSNSFFDPATNKTFDYHDPKCSKDEDEMWFKGEPIWVTANKSNHKTASLMWIGSEAKIQGITPTYVIPYSEETKNMDYDEKVDAIFSWLELPASDRPSFISVYIPDLDTVGHQYGTDSHEIDDALINIDRMFDKLLRKLEDSQLINFIDLIIVSDHGMTNTDTEKLLYVDDYLDLDEVMVNDYYPFATITPKNISDIDKVYEKLLKGSHVGNETQYQVWLTTETDSKKNIPDKYHYSHKINNRISPIVSLPNPPYSWVIRKDFDKDTYPRALHGYDNSLKEMRSIFLASGPSFQKELNYTINPFSNTELYEMMCRILKIKPAPNNSTENGRALFDKVLSIQ